VGPRLAIVSVGRNGYGHPSPAAVSRILDYGAELRRTDMCGAVSISIALHTAGQVAGGQVDYRARDMRSVWARAPLFRKLGV
jgi:beta-lactamase superfamily II metal-dependent hydrolase